MLFNSFQYWIFFFIVLALFYSVPFRVGKVLLLGASCAVPRRQSPSPRRQLYFLHVVGPQVHRIDPHFDGS